MPISNTITEFVRTRLRNCNTITIFVGVENTILSAYSVSGFVRTINIANTGHEFLGKYRSFLKQFNGWNVILLIDDENVKIKKATIPILQSMLQNKNQVKNFVISEVGDTELVAYDEYDEIKNESDNYEKKVVFCHAKISSQIHDIVTFIYNLNFPLIGIYLLPLEIKAILKNIISNIGISINDSFTILVVPTLTSGIRLFAFDDGQLYASKIVAYPHGKSHEYIVGLIEESVESFIIKHKKHIESKRDSISIISLTSSQIADLISKKDIVSSWCALSWDAQKIKASFGDFADEMLLRNLKIQHNTTNKSIRKIHSMEFLNKKILNGILILITLGFFYAGFLEYKVLSKKSNLDRLSNEYYKISESYRDARKKIQEVTNLPDIYDIISDIAILKSSVPQAVEITKHVFDVTNPSINLYDITWDLTKEDIGSMESRIVMKIRYEDNVTEVQELEKHLLEYSTSLTRVFPNYKIELIEDNKGIIKLNDKIVMPVKFTIKGPMESVK